MNCKIENRSDFLKAKIVGWREVTSCGVDRYERARGRRNLKRLIGAYPAIAVDCGIGQPPPIPSAAGTVSTAEQGASEFEKLAA